MRGVLLVNLGTPLSYSRRDVARYLSEFLTDERVIDAPYFKRQLLVRGVIVPSRCKQSAKQYQAIWTEEGSPLLFHSLKLQSLLQKALGDDHVVELGMRYQYPSIKEALEKLKSRRVESLVVIPLFPHYASATSGSAIEEVLRCLQGWQLIPELRVVNSFYDTSQVIDAYCARARQYVIANYDHLVMSFHGLPMKSLLDKRTKERIPPRWSYDEQCQEMARLIAAKLGLAPGDYTVAFQSRLGKEPWIEPYTSDVIQNLAHKGAKRLLVMSPSFVCDCLETSYEIGIEVAHAFMKAGGKELQLVEGLNEHPLWVEALKKMVERC